MFNNFFSIHPFFTFWLDITITFSHMSICTLTSITLLVYNKTNVKTSLLSTQKRNHTSFGRTNLHLLCGSIVSANCAHLSCRPKSLTELSCKFFCKKNVWFLFRHLITHLFCFFLTKLRFRLSINQSSDQFYRLFNTIAGTVDAQIIVDGISPALAGI